MCISLFKRAYNVIFSGFDLVLLVYSFTDRIMAKQSQQPSSKSHNTLNPTSTTNNPSQSQANKAFNLLKFIEKNVIKTTPSDSSASKGAGREKSGTNNNKLRGEEEMFDAIMVSEVSVFELV